MNRQAIKETLKPLIKSPYVLVSAGFLLWMLFVDEDNIIKRYELSRKVSVLQAEKMQLQEDIRQTVRKMEELKSSSRENLEKFAREEYLMKRDDEVIFIVKD